MLRDLIRVYYVVMLGAICAPLCLEYSFAASRDRSQTETERFFLLVFSCVIPESASDWQNDSCVFSN